MKMAKVIVLIWIACCLLIWVQGPQRFFILLTLPFITRPYHLPPEYDVLATLMIGCSVWAYVTYRRRRS